MDPAVSVWGLILTRFLLLIAGVFIHRTRVQPTPQPRSIGVPSVSICRSLCIIQEYCRSMVSRTSLSIIVEKSANEVEAGSRLGGSRAIHLIFLSNGTFRGGAARKSRRILCIYLSS